MVCLGFEPWAAKWQAQTKPRSYGGRPSIWHFTGESRIRTADLINLASTHALACFVLETFLAILMPLN